MTRTRLLRLSTLALIALILALVASLSGDSVRAQGTIQPLRVEEAVTGQLTADAPTVVYSFSVQESLRMGVVFDVQGDMPVTLVVLDQDQSTTLAGSTGPNANGLVVTFPSEGQYYLGLTAQGGTSASYRLMIDADPPLPINAFVMQSYLVAGTSTSCAENTPVGAFTAAEDLNVCFVLSLIGEPTELTLRWWSPSGQMVNEEHATADDSFNGQRLLSGIVYEGTAWEAGWWQAHILLNGELAHIQWVPVNAPE
jgi:hypothetical protein